MEVPQKKSVTDLGKDLRLTRPFWLGRELVALLVWGLAFVHLFIADLLGPLAAAVPALAPLVRFRLVLFLGAIGLALLVLSPPRFVALVVFVLVYPLVLLLWRIPQLLFRNWPTVVVFAPAIQGVLSNIRLHILLLTLGSLGAAGIAFGERAEVVAASMVALAVYLVSHFARRVRAVFSPSTVFFDAGKILRTVWESAIKGSKSVSQSVRLQDLDPRSPEYEQVFGQSVLNLYFFSTLLGSIARRLQAIHETRRLDVYFASSFLFTMLLTWVVFALLYLGLAELDPGAFTGRVTFAELLGYSFGTLTHFQLSPIAPATGLARLVSYSEVFSSVVLVVLLAFVLFTSARERHRSDLEAVVADLAEASSSLEAEIAANYDVTIRVAEQKLLAFNDVIARYLLRLRYGPEAAKAIEEELAMASDEPLRELGGT